MAFNVIINGRVFEAQDGELILTVCRRNNIFIPTFCHHDGLPGLGTCRLCVVEINEGSGFKVVASCVYPLSCDCEIFTDSKKLIDVRKTLLSMLRIKAPRARGLFALCKMYNVEDDARYTVPAIADDDIQTESQARQAKSLSLTEKEREAQIHLALSCIVCGLCVKACSNMGTGVLLTAGRGIAKNVTTPYDEPSSGCTGCASCASVCPAAAIEYYESDGKRFIWGREFSLLNCASCGKSFATAEEYALSLKKAEAENNDASLDNTLCETCRRKKAAGVFAETFGESAL